MQGYDPYRGRFEDEYFAEKRPVYGLPGQAYLGNVRGELQRRPYPYAQEWQKRAVEGYKPSYQGQMIGEPIEDTDFGNPLDNYFNHWLFKRQEQGGFPVLKRISDYINGMRYPIPPQGDPRWLSADYSGAQTRAGGKIFNDKARLDGSQVQDKRVVYRGRGNPSSDLIQ
jgi:hypothetical protein